MGQASDSGRNASLDDKKRRAAGRREQSDPALQAIREGVAPQDARGKAAGAFGREGKANRKGGGYTQGAGGGGGAQSPAKDAPINTPASRKTH